MGATIFSGGLGLREQRRAVGGAERVLGTGDVENELRKCVVGTGDVEKWLRNRVVRTEKVENAVRNCV